MYYQRCTIPRDGPEVVLAFKNVEIESLFMTGAQSSDNGAIGSLPIFIPSPVEHRIWYVTLDSINLCPLSSFSGLLNLFKYAIHALWNVTGPLEYCFT